MSDLTYCPWLGCELEIRLPANTFTLASGFVDRRGQTHSLASAFPRARRS